MVAVSEAPAGAGLVVFGVWVAKKPRAWANFGEQLDAIGSTRDANEVTAAEWNVQLTKYSGVAFALVGALVVALAMN